MTDTDLPLDDAARLRAAPDFLTAEQQTLYRQAFALYSAMFDGETTGIDDAFPAAGGQTEYDEYTPEWLRLYLHQLPQPLAVLG